LSLSIKFLNVFCFVPRAIAKAEAIVEPSQDCFDNIKLPEDTLSNAKDFSALIFIPLLRGFDVG